MPTRWHLEMEETFLDAAIQLPVWPASWECVVLHEKVVMADGSSSVRVTTYDTSSRKLEVSGFETLTTANQFAFQPQHRTAYTYDGFGRPLSVTQPDGKVTNLAYGGGATVTRTSSNRDGAGCRDQRARHRNLRPVRPARATHREVACAGSQFAVATSYTYDVGNRLASTTTMSQTRLFEYDKRGFLLRERAPEKGLLGNGYVEHSTYDARGHALRTVEGTNDLTYIYDAAERLLPVAETGGAQRVIKSFEYATSNGPSSSCVVNGCDARNGKLSRAIRYNHDPVLGTVAVTQDEHYTGVGGRTSARDTTVASGAGSKAPRSRFSKRGMPLVCRKPRRIPPALCRRHARRSRCHGIRRTATPAA